MCRVPEDGTTDIDGISASVVRIHSLHRCHRSLLGRRRRILGRWRLTESPHGRRLWLARGGGLLAANDCVAVNNSTVDTYLVESDGIWAPVPVGPPSGGLSSVSCTSVSD